MHSLWRSCTSWSPGDDTDENELLYTVFTLYLHIIQETPGISHKVDTLKEVSESKNYTHLMGSLHDVAKDVDESMHQVDKGKSKLTLKWSSLWS